MLKVKRSIYIGDQTIQIWLGLMLKNGRYTVYLLTDDPNNPFNHADKILTHIQSKDEAIKQGVLYAKNLFRNIIKNQEIDDSQS